MNIRKKIRNLMKGIDVKKIYKLFATLFHTVLHSKSLCRRNRPIGGNQ